MTDRDRLYDLLEFNSENLPNDDELLSAALTHIVAMERQISRLREFNDMITDVVNSPTIRFKREIEDE